MNLAILGTGPVCAFGAGTDALKQGLKTATPVLRAGSLEEPAPLQTKYYKSQPDGLARFVEPRLLRRMDKFTQMALLSSHLCLEDAGILTLAENKERIGIVFGTAYGAHSTTFSFLDSIIDQGDELASPTLFANSVHNAPASQISISLQLTGPCITITGFEHTAINVFRTAALWLSSGNVDYVLAGIGEEYGDVLGYAANALSKTPGTGYLPGEGIVTFLLAPDSVKHARYGYLELPEGKQNPGALPADLAALFVHNSRCRFEKQELVALATDNYPLLSYISCYGRMMTGIGFEIAFAALALKEGRLDSPPVLSGFYPDNPQWHTGTILLSTSAKIGCLDIKGRPEGETSYDFYQIYT